MKPREIDDEVWYPVHMGTRHKCVSCGVPPNGDDGYSVGVGFKSEALESLCREGLDGPGRICVAQHVVWRSGLRAAVDYAAQCVDHNHVAQEKP